MKIALIGATGKAGTCLVNELTSRRHQVTGIARSASGGGDGIPMRQADANDPASLADAVRGHDAVMLAGRFVSVDAAKVIEALQKAGVSRLLVVGGAGSLFVSPGVQLVDTGLIPEPFLPEVTGGRSFLETLKTSALDWTFLSPAANFGPGKRTGKYRLGGDDLMRDEKGDSRISYEDLAKALVDELEKPRHNRARFSIAY